MRALLTVIDPPGFELRAGVRQRQELLDIGTLSRKRPLNDSMCELSVGFPGRVKSSCTPRSKTQASSALDMNSIP